MCQFCDNRKGGAPGNENVIAGVKVCDYCTPLAQRIWNAGRAAERLGQDDLDYTDGSK